MFTFLALEDNDDHKEKDTAIPRLEEVAPEVDLKDVALIER